MFYTKETTLVCVGGRTQAATQTHTHAFNANKVLVNVLHGGGSVESVPSEVRYYTTAACLSRAGCILHQDQNQQWIHSTKINISSSSVSSIVVQHPLKTHQWAAASRRVTCSFITEGSKIERAKRERGLCSLIIHSDGYVWLIDGFKTQVNT